MVGEIRIVHGAVRGRTRLHLPRLYRNRPLAVALARSLSTHPSVRSATPNVHTGNVLILFDPAVPAEDVLAVVVALLDHIEHDPPIGFTAVARDRSGGGGTGARPASGGTAGPAWHALNREQVLLRLDTTAEGLSSDEARRRSQRYGPNELKAAAPRPLGDIVGAQFRSLPVVLLIGSAALSVLTGGLVDAVVIVGVVLANAAIGAYTEARAERTISALTRFSAPPVLTERGGARTPVDVSSLVPGDVIRLARGDYVSADARLLESTDLTVAESALTGESVPVTKNARAVLDERKALGDRVNMVHRGTVVTGGNGVAVVVAIGAETEVGRIQALVADAAPPATPLQLQLRALGHQMVVITGAVCGCMVVTGRLRGYGLLEIVRTAISLAVAAIPEGLPTVATVTLATGIHRLRERGLLVRRLDAVETLGAVQVVCLDKTGTITANRMAVQTGYVDGRRLRFAEGTVRDEGDAGATVSRSGLMWLLRVGTLCSDAAVHIDGGGTPRVDGTSTESALVHLALDLGQDVIELRARFPMVSHLARAERRMYMTTVHATPDGRRLIVTKGRPDQVLTRCRSLVSADAVRDLTPADGAAIEAENERMAGEGLRVLGFAFAESDPERPIDETPLVWAGLVGIADPPRPGIREVIEGFGAAGIRTIMITGDQSATACAVARAIGLGRTRDLEVLDSDGLAGIPDPLLSALASRVDVFSRVSPSNKLQVVRALQRAGLVVAMTGDGVNDGPALRASDVGIAMGRGGTELAREVADMVLFDDDLGALLEAVAEGRTIADDIRKSVHFIVATNLSEILLTLGATALGFGVPLTATQLLWINLLTDVFPELALAVDPRGPDVLQRRPRSPRTPLVSAADASRLGVDAIVMTGSAMTGYLVGLRRQGRPGEAGTMAFLTLTGAQLLHAFSARSEAHSLLERGRPRNPWIGLAVAGGFGVQALAGVLPPLRRALGTVRVGVGDVALSWGLAALSFVVGEGLKLLAPGTRWRTGAPATTPLRTPAPAGSVPFVEGVKP